MDITFTAGLPISFSLWCLEIRTPNLLLSFLRIICAVSAPCALLGCTSSLSVPSQMWTLGLDGCESHTCILPEIFTDLFQDDNISFFTSNLNRNQNILAKFARPRGKTWDTQMEVKSHDFPNYTTMYHCDPATAMAKLHQQQHGVSYVYDGHGWTGCSVWEVRNSSWMWVLWAGVWKRSPTTLWDHLSHTCSEKALPFGCYLGMGEMWKINLKVFPDKGNLSSNIETAGSEPS